MATRFENLVTEAKKNVGEISPQKAAEAAEKGGALIVDVREPGEYKESHVPRAINIPRGLLEIRADPAGHCAVGAIGR